MTTLKTRESPTSRSSAAVENRWLGVALIVLGFGAALVALLGPLVFGVIDYHASEGAVNQIIGGDVAGLFLVAPVSILAGVLVWRGRRGGSILALAPAIYGLYMYSQLALGGDVFRYPGNSERFFVIYLGLFILAGFIAIRSWQVVQPDSLPTTRRRVDLTLGIFFLVVAAFLAVGLHLPGLVDAWSTQPTGPEYLADPVVFWLVKFMDLGLVVPGLIVAGVGILRRARWAGKLKYVVVGWAALLGASVAGMAIVMQATNDPAGTLANSIAFTGFAAFAVGMAWVVYRPLLGEEPGKAAGSRMQGEVP